MGDADDQAQVGADDGLACGGRCIEQAFQPAQLAMAGDLLVEFAAGGGELVLEEVILEEEGPFVAGGKQRRAIEFGQLGREIAGHAQVFGGGRTGQFLGGEHCVDQRGGIVVMEERIVVEAHVLAGEPLDALVEKNAVDDGTRAMQGAGDFGDICPVLIRFESRCAIGLPYRRRCQAQYRGLRVFLIVLDQRMQDGHGRALHAPGQAAGDEFDGAAGRRQGSSATDNVIALVFAELREVGVGRDLIAMIGQEALDALKQEADASAAVGEDESPRRQAASPPALDGFAGDVEAAQTSSMASTGCDMARACRLSPSLTCSMSRPRSC